MSRMVGVRQHYGVRPILRGVDLEVRSGELAAIVGPNGVGKTTLLAAMAGVLSPQAGFVEIDGRKRRESEEAELEIRRQVVYLPDQPWLPELRTGREFLLAVGRLYDVEDERLFDHVERLMKLFDLESQADQPIRSCSAGQRKKIALGSALVTEAPILVLDEPFSGGLDPSGILALKRVLKHLADRQDATVVMATPVPELVEELAHRVAVLRDGQIIAYDTVEGLRRETQCSGSLAEILERMMHPQTLRNIEQYFQRTVLPENGDSQRTGR